MRNRDNTIQHKRYRKCEMLQP